MWIALLPIVGSEVVTWTNVALAALNVLQTIALAYLAAGHRSVANKVEHIERETT